ncbi:nuclear pore membrane glycoprotein 210 isoform X2 [Periplaneta americana]
MRNTAIVFAEEKNSGLILRCDVIVDVISSLNLVTTTRELFMEEAPEAFEVRAYDDQGNEFTTLEGVEFQWSLSNWNAHQESSSSGPCNVLRFITFRDSPYETPPTVQAFDEVGKHGHIVLLEGIKTGSAKVSVRLPYSEYQDVSAIEVQLMIVANLIIDPADIYLLKGDSVRYRVLQVHHGRLEEISLPSQQYFLAIDDTTIASINEKTAVVSGLKIGKTKVLLHDRNVDEKEAGIRVPAATLTVNDPCYLTLALLPHRNWILMIEEHYEIVVEAYDSDDHKFFIGDGVQVLVSIPEEYFHVHSSTVNNTHHFGWPVQVGTSQVNATLEGVKDSSGVLQPSPRISAIADMLIYNRITIHPSEVALPWDPIIQPKYEVGLNASGGDGSFIWSSHNTSVAVVTQTGLVKTHARGQTEISAAMARNHHNREVANVYILPASHLEIVEYVLEAEIGTPIFLHVAVFADRPDSILSTRSRIPFSHCDDLPLVIKIWSDHFVNSSLKIAPVGISCTTVALIGQSVGNAKVTVSYTFQEHTIADSALIGAYRPLTIVHPESRETVLAVGTSREVLFSGGPRPWIGRASEHVHQIILEGDEKIVEVTELVDRTEENSDNYLYRVLCKELGEVHVTLQITNVPSVGHCKKSLSEASLKVHCARPRYVTMTSEQPDTASCPLNLNSGKLVVQNYKELELLVVVKDEHGRVFDNVTSLYFDWKLSHSTLGTLVEKGSVISKAIQEEEIILPNKNYQVLKPTARTGVLDVSVTVVAYHSEKLEKMGIFHEDPPFGITNERGYVVTPEILASLSLILVNDTVITPNQTTVFNHARNKVNLQVNQGSGYYEFILSSEEIADINYVESTKVLEVIPKIDGLLKIALVDLCLVSKPAIAEVQVLGVGSIKVEVPERVERGQCVSAIVRLYDTMDNLLPVPSAEFLDLRPKPDSGIIGIKMQQDKKSSLPLGEIRYIVTGLELGETGLKFTSGRGQREIHSQRLFIQVFPPLRLFPRNVTLIVGSVCQISSRGGPQPDANIEYSISAADIVTISTSGVVTGSKLGASVVTAKAVGVSKMTGNKVVYSQDSIEVHVIQLQGINIHAPLSRLKTGTTMPIWAQGIPDVLSPIVIGTVVPSLRFTWSVSTREVGRVHHVFEEFGLTIAAEDMVSMRFTAMSPGRTILRMDVYVPLSLGGRLDEPSYHDSIEIEVFEELLLIRPPYPLNQQSPMLLLAPNSEVQLRTNRDGLAKMTYSLGGKLLPIGQGSDNETVSKALTDPDHLLTVEPGGLVKSHNRLGRSVIMVIAKEDFGIRQILSISVEVKEVLYIMLTPLRRVIVEDEVSLGIIPQGFEMELSVSYHDSSGSPFTASKSSIKLRTNRYDLAQLRSGEANNSLVVNLMGNGETMLKVWDDLTPQQAAVYVKMHVGGVIYPAEARELLRASALTVGDVVCFSMPLSSIDGVRGTWDTDNENILSLDPTLGIGRVRTAGNVIVKYHLPSSVSTFIELEALPVTSIKFLEPSNKTLVNTVVSPNFRVPIVLENSRDTDKIGNLISRNGTCPFTHYRTTAFPFMCEIRFDSPVADVDVQDVFAASQDFDINTGTYGCVILPSGTLTVNKSVLHTNFSLHVFTGSVFSQPFKIPFKPAMYVHSEQVNLSDARMAAYVTVSGRPDILKQVRVYPYDGKDFLTVSGPDVMETNKAYYQVRLTDKYWKEADLTTPMSIIVNSEVTFQNIEVPVVVRLVGGSGWSQGPCVISRYGLPVSDTVYYYRHTFSVIGSLIVIFLVTLFAYFHYIHPMLQPVFPLQPYRANDAGPMTSTSLMDTTRMSPSLYRIGSHPSSMTPVLDPVYGDPQLYYQPSEPQTVRSRRIY